MPSKTISLIVLVIVIAAIALSAYFYTQYRSEQRRAQDLLGKTQGNAQKEVEELVGTISKLYELPTGEVPTVATVSDVAKLSGQPFFAHAKNGDKVLIYANAKKAVLFRPDTNKIIEVGPVNLAPTTSPVSKEETGTPSASATTTESVTVALYNGTTKVGLTRTAEQKLKDQEKTVSVVVRSNATKQDYAKTIVIDLTGKNKAAAQKYAAFVGGSVVSLPAGETKPEKEAELLIILGADFQ